MTAKEFDKLPLSEKAELLWRGDFIDVRAIYNKSYIELYKVEDFFAELFYDARTNEIQHIITTTEAEVLENYCDINEVYLTNTGVRPPQA